MIQSQRAEAFLAKILLIDDDAVLVRALSKALEGQGYQVRALSRGTTALEEALEFRPHLVILDVMMPGVDGWEVLSRLRGNSVTASTPVLMLTAKGTEPSKVRGFSLGADDYVTKPFGLQELRWRVVALLRRAGAHAVSAEGSLPVTVGGSALELIPVREIYYVEGVRNYTYVHTYDNRSLSRLTLGAVDARGLDPLARVHRSFIVNLNHVVGCYWATKSSYHIRLGDHAATEIPVSRPLISEVQQRLGVKSG